MPIVISCDVGTTSVKAAAFNRDGAVLASTRRHVAVMEQAPFGRVQDSETFVTEALSALRECVAEVSGLGGSPEALVFTGQQAGLVLVDDQGRAISWYYSWLDTTYNDVWKMVPSTVMERARANCGSYDPMHLSRLIRARDLMGEKFRKARAWTIAGPYVAERLADNPRDGVFIDIGSICYSGAANLERLDWDAEVLEAVGLPGRLHPRIARPTEVIGGLGRSAADYVGLPSGLPILAGIGDFPAATLGARVPLDHLGEILATASVSFGLSTRFPTNLPGSLRVMRAPLDDTWLTFDLVYGGDLVRWFCEDVIGGGTVPDSAIGQVPNELWFVPFGATTPDYIGPRGWIGLSERVKQSDMYGSLLEGLAFEQEWSRQQIASVLELPNTSQASKHPIHVLGGSGCTNVWWLRAKAAISGRTFAVYEGEDPTLVGGAAIAARTLGWASDADSDWGSHSGREAFVVPEMADVERLQERLRRYLRLTGRFA